MKGTASPLRKTLPKSYQRPFIHIEEYRKADSHVKTQQSLNVYFATGCSKKKNSLIFLFFRNKECHFSEFNRAFSFSANRTKSEINNTDWKKRENNVRCKIQ